MKLIIVEWSGRTVVAEVENYTGPVPREGEYITRPAVTPGAPDNVMRVNTVTYGILARPQNGEDCFVGDPEPCVEICV